MNQSYADAGKPDVLIVAASHDQESLAEIVRAAGGHVQATTGWAGLPNIGADMPVRLILAATTDVADEALSDGLPRISRLAVDGNCGVVVSLDDAQIDLVAAVLMGPDVELLCRPGPGALAAAVALGLARRGGVLADTVREREADRLRRLNDEVARIADVLSRLTGTADRRPGTVADRGMDYRAPPAAAASPVSAADVRKAIRARRLRDQQFPGMLEDPAWDMLLDLYAADLEGAQVSVSSLCIAAAVPATTALRWIARMTEAGLFDRQPDPFDRRRAFMALSGEGRDRMQRYFTALGQTGLRIA